MYTVYGISNCDTVKKSLTWLKAHGIAYEFHDYKKLGITASRLKDWSKQVGWEVLLNKKGTTWRKLDETLQKSITSEIKALALMAENTSSIKRPVIMDENKVLTVGFDEAAYSKLFHQ